MKNKLGLILIGLAVADLLGAIDATGVNIALPNITRDLAIPVTVAQWIPNAYTLVLVAMLIFMGKVGDTIGPKKLYLAGLGLFGIASLILGFTNNPYLLIAIRAIQGLGTAILYTMPMSIIAHLWRDREKAFAVTASFFAAGMFLGPMIGGILANLNIGNFQGWHLIFLLNIPFIIFGLWVAAKYIPQIPTEKKKFNFLSLGLLLAGLILIVLSLTIISRYYIIAGLAVLILLFQYEKKLKTPLVDFNLFKNPTFTAANLVSFFAMVTIIGMSFVLTFYLQDTLKWNSLQAGLAFMPVPIVTAIFAGLGGQIKNWRLGAILTAASILVGIILLTQVNPAISYFKLILPGIILISAGSGILMTVIFAAILGSAPTESSGNASGILNTIQQLGGLIGIALVATLVSSYNMAFIYLTVAAILGLLSAYFVKNKTAIS